eukprot:1212105-Pleurochrysis_carterae.AAC.1
MCRRVTRVWHAHEHDVARSCQLTPLAPSHPPSTSPCCAGLFRGRQELGEELQLYGQQPSVVIALAANTSDLDEYRVLATQ